ncbi:MAG: inositol 2-dehydrogenase [Candidatus Latescibacterota bacterium]|nr:MAG: inositol 2-dehydrogenase [Candidatus Latescibacterota bacterium]
MERKLGVGVIGAGRIGMLHAQNLSRHVPGCRVVAIADRRVACARAAASASGGGDAVADPNALLARDDIHAVVICSSTDTHTEIIRQAANAGKHIFCEKPIDHDLGRIRDALESVQRAGVLFQVGFNRRFDPDFKSLAVRVREGDVGEPHLLRISSRDPEPPPIDYIKVSGGLFMDMSIHDLDMAHFLVAEPIVEVFAAGSAHDPAIGGAGDVDTAVVVLRYASGALCTIDNSRRAVYGYDQRIEVFGSRGCLSVPNRTPTGVDHWDERGQHRERPQHFFMQRYRESYVAEMQAFVECVRLGREPAVSGQEGLHAVQLAHAARDSCAQNRPVRIATAAAHDDAA